MTGKQCSQRTLFNGGITQYTVDDANRLTALASYFANNRLGRFDYGYDQLNRRKYEQRDFGVADGFQYDPRERTARGQFQVFTMLRRKDWRS